MSDLILPSSAPSTLISSFTAARQPTLSCDSPTSLSRLFQQIVIMGSVMLQHLPSAWHVDQAIVRSSLLTPCRLLTLRSSVKRPA